MRAFTQGRDIMAHDAKINRRRTKPTKENVMNVYHPYPDDRAGAIREAKRLFDLNPLFLDTETTGLGNTDQVCEIAVIDLEGNVLIDSLVKPTISIGVVAASLHGITDETVQHAPSFRDLLPDLDRVLNGRTVLVYNVNFDEDMIHHSTFANGFKNQRSAHDGIEAWWWDPEGWNYEKDGLPDRKWYCVMELYAQFYGVYNDYHHSYRWQRLGTAAEQCDITLPETIHRAHADAELTRRILLYMATANSGAEQQTNQTQGEQNAEL